MNGRSVPVAVGLVAAMAVVLLALAVAGPAVADSHDEDVYHVEQGEQCVEVHPYDRPDETVEEFYDYRNPYTEPASYKYSSYGTREEQQNDTSLLLLHRGADGLSLVIVHDKLVEDHEGAGTNGGAATFVVTGIDPGDGWAVEDDDYGDQSDEFNHGSDSSEMNWVWSQNRTDGAAYTGLEGDFEVGIDPAWGEDANLERPSNGYQGEITDWQVLSNTGDGFERTSLQDLDSQVFVRPGPCDGASAAPPNATLDVDDTSPEIGVDEVALDASGSEAEAGVAEYRWDVTGDGDADETTEGAVLDHVFESDVGEREVTVTVVDENGETDSDGVTVTVVDETPPEAVIEAPGQATAGEPVELSGASSSDNHLVDVHQWDLDDGTTTDGEVVEHAFEDPGEYQVELRAVDPSGNEDVATATVEVQPDDGPTAALDAPDEAAVNETVTLDASGSEAADDATYEFGIDDDTEAVSDQPTHDVSFDEAGTYTLWVTVEDGNGSDTAETTIDVRGDLTAQADANRTTVETGEPIAFDAGGSSDDADGYEWDLGDGANATGEQVTHAYDDAGDYTVELVVERGDETATDTVQITVESADNSSDDGDDSDGSDDGDDSTDDSGQSDDGDSDDDGGSSSGSQSSQNRGYGGGGGSAPPRSTPEPEPDPVDASVDVEDGTVIVEAEDLEDGTPVVADVSTDGPVALEEVRVVVGEDVDSFTAALVPVEAAVPGRFADRPAFDLETETDVESVTYEFAVDASAVAETGAEPSNLVAYSRGHDWGREDTTVDDGGDRVTVTTEVDGARTVGVGAEGAVLLVTDVEADDPGQNVPFVLTATVRNTGTAPASRDVPIRVGDATVVAEDVLVGPGGVETVDVTTTVHEAGEVQISQGGAVHRLSIQPGEADLTVVDLEVSSHHVGTGETVEVAVAVRNAGTARGERTVEVAVDDSVVGSETVALEPGETATVTVEHRLDDVGVYEVSADGHAETVRVGDAAGLGAAETDDEGSGFGVLAAVVALLLAVAGGVYRRAG